GWGGGGGGREIGCWGGGRVGGFGGGKSGEERILPLPPARAGPLVAADADSRRCGDIEVRYASQIGAILFDLQVGDEALGAPIIADAVGFGYSAVNFLDLFGQPSKFPHVQSRNARLDGRFDRAARLELSKIGRAHV